MTYYSTGEVSKKLNISVRTLRYYDQIKLVQPTYKNESGKRFYSSDDMLLLQKIQLLKSTSMSLEHIGKIVKLTSTEKTLNVHKKKLEIELNRLQQSLNHTNTLLNILKLEGKIEWEQLLPLLNEDLQHDKKQKKEALMEVLFSAEEQTVIETQLPKLESNHSLTTLWINIIERVSLCLENQTAPESREGQLIAFDIMILSKEMFSGNAELANKFWEVRKSQQASSELQLYPIDQPILEFVEKAIIYYEQHEHSK
ncbi:DNA-binding transcriptional MerR regulator [Cytobacillus horneckiae]|uniref:MerR family transcriptional regulator n=1 Tax=Cytobacillus horneckiae TaxID=549687 RepID=UPI0019D01FE3|nr:MerR family transcriptional regulator [Cytobacillus horneckiae]MBN6888701.1 MerR family transcriptional regulator [Cytobacillus horneckiae]